MPIVAFRSKLDYNHNPSVLPERLPMLTRKLLAALLAISLGTVGLAACNDSNPSAPSSESDSDDSNDDSDSSEEDDNDGD